MTILVILSLASGVAFLKRRERPRSPWMDSLAGAGS